MPHVDPRRRNKPSLGASASGLGGNGAASPSAGQRENPAPPKASRMGSGRDQALAFALAVFKGADKNSDGTLTKSEIRKYFKANPKDKVRLIPPLLPAETSSSPTLAHRSRVWVVQCLVPSGVSFSVLPAPPLVSSLYPALSLQCSVQDTQNVLEFPFSRRHAFRSQPRRADCTISPCSHLLFHCSILLAQRSLTLTFNHVHRNAFVPSTNIHATP